MNPPYLILQKQSRILNISNPVVCVFDNIGSKCKIIYRFKISAKAGIQFRNTGFRVKPGMTNKVKGFFRFNLH
jgi:hypothetical protein